MKQKQAVAGTVTGNDQHVGFRAMIMKQAIAYNLAGFAKNLPDDVVSFTLQGDADRLAAGRRGDPRRHQEVVQHPGQHGGGDGRSGLDRVHRPRLDVDEPEHHRPV